MTNSPTTRLLTAKERADVVSLAIRGESVARIARSLSLPQVSVRNACRTAAEEIRAASAAKVAVRFWEHDDLLQRLITRLTSDLLSPDGGWCKDRANALVKLLERQSRLLGLDTAKVGNALDSADWIGEKTDAELVSTLRDRYGINVPPDLLPPSRN